MRIFISAAEASSDAHGAELLKALQAEAQLRGFLIEAVGLGGPKLKSAGLEIWQDGRELRAMGFTEILGKIPKGYLIIKALLEKIKAQPIEAAIFLDYPEFHFRLSAKVAQKFSKVPLFYYIAPKIWVWRSHRAKILKERFKKVFSIFEFEVEFLRSLGVAVEYCGNPLLDELPRQLSKSEARRLLRSEVTSGAHPWVTLMPGSRVAEIKQHLRLFLEALQLVPALKGGAEVLIPIQEQDRSLVESLLVDWPKSHLNLHVITEIKGATASHICMRASDFGIIKSGTSTLEAAILELPHILVYRPSALTCWIFKNVIRYKKFVGLPNLILNREWIPEILMEAATPERLAAELEKLDPDFMKAGFLELRGKLGTKTGESPSRLVAQKILNDLRTT